MGYMNLFILKSCQKHCRKEAQKTRNSTTIINDKGRKKAQKTQKNPASKIVSLWISYDKD